MFTKIVPTFIFSIFCFPAFKLLKLDQLILGIFALEIFPYVQTNKNAISRKNYDYMPKYTFNN